MEKQRTRLTVLGGTFILILTGTALLNMLILNRSYAFFTFSAGNSVKWWLALHMGSVLSQMTIPLTFLLAGYFWANKRVSVGTAAASWLRGWSLLLLSLVIVFVGFKTLSMNAILESLFPLTRGVSTVFSGMIVCLVTQPLLVRWIQRTNIRFLTLVLGSLWLVSLFWNHFRQDANDPINILLMVALFMIGMLLSRSGWWQKRSLWQLVAIGGAALLTMWASLGVMGKISFFLYGNYDVMDTFTKPFSVLMVVAAIAVTVFVGRLIQQSEGRMLVVALTMANLVSQAPTLSAFISDTIQNKWPGFLHFLLTSAIFAGVLAVALLGLIWGTQPVWTRVAGRLDQQWHLTTVAEYARIPTRLNTWGRAVFSQHWHQLVAVAVFYVTAFVSFLSMTRDGLVGDGLLSKREPVLPYLLLKDQKMIVLTTLMLIAACVVLHVITTRFWVSFLLVEVSYSIWTIANRMKIGLRNESVLPADLHELKSLPELFAMVGTAKIVLMILAILLAIGAIVFLEIRLPRPLQAKWPARIGLIVLAGLILASPIHVNQKGSYANAFNRAFGNAADFVTPINGVQTHGPLLQFTNSLDVQLMDEPDDYSAERVAAIVQKYAAQAKQINKTRTANIKDQTVIFNLSESFVDPKRFPDTHIDGQDPIPNVRKLMKQTTSGYMMSAGYGGGTANMEYESFSGFIMSGFTHYLVPFTQVVTRSGRAPGFADDFPSGTAIHPYTGSFYNRPQAYRKMGIKTFKYLGSQYKIIDQSKIQNSPYLSDNTAYANALQQINQVGGGQFMNLVTMQNHMPYDASFYPDNPFQDTVSGAALSNDAITSSYATYTYGTYETDKAVKKFIDEIDKIKKPITLVFYGDHYPAIIDNDYVLKDPVRMHATDFFIYSNKASRAHNTKLKKTHYSGTNDFIPMVLEHLNAKVSPYEALLTDVDHDLPALSMPAGTKTDADGNTENVVQGVTNKGKLVTVDKLTKKQKQLLADYQMIQYDITSGKQYSLKGNTFMKNPGGK
ncbi:sulfatase-like hydrolase/transferase [Schleiferilactobacillus perolens]|uniref:Phosphoglycerol transferase alkaline phosphatase superfamily protein n=1 Tax=Schleiferilactobacillus perolens DSM 12744 TaxID=1423792 RepID=A0A0R1MWQ5_9LACO|nr:sulfatase-like hydrolase/transferase [Schleiferilactobacillus perolens]KRL12608.1 phosphoglycerol transferase alkaline phosphatase superfamily protein [Schleiferilactobacillus perolens DSM 12744]